MSEKEYNGYTNYATFSVAVVIDNDPEMSRGVRRLAEAASRKQLSRVRMEDDLRDWVRDMARADGDLPEMASQLVAAGISEVNFRELAIGYLNAISE